MCATAQSAAQEAMTLFGLLPPETQVERDLALPSPEPRTAASERVLVDERRQRVEGYLAELSLHRVGDALPALEAAERVRVKLGELAKAAGDAKAAKGPRASKGKRSAQ
jgi:hypothetical protein